MNIATRELRAARRTGRTPHIEVRLGRTEDAPKVLDFIEMFFHATPWSQTMRFNRKSAGEFLPRAIGNGFAPHALAFDGDELVGMCSYHIFSVYTDPIAVMDECYVLPRLRRSDLGRRLVGLAIELAKADGCVIMNFPIASQLKEQNGLMNMVGRHFGAEYCGMIFRKTL
jgi:GNAT superfamily N-acetyltransferase